MASSRVSVLANDMIDNIENNAKLVATEIKVC